MHRNCVIGTPYAEYWARRGSHRANLVRIRLAARKHSRDRSRILRAQRAPDVRHGVRRWRLSLAVKLSVCAR